MAAFPRLRTGAICQYPLERRIAYRSDAVVFVDGTVQRMAAHAGTDRTWRIRLDLLRETEVAELEQFFDSHQGPAGTFAFTDPASGETFADCCFAEDAMTTVASGFQRGSTDILIRRRRS